MKNSMFEINSKEDVFVALAPFTRHQKCLVLSILSNNILESYNRFYEKENWGNPRILNDAVAILFENIFSESSLSEAASRIKYDLYQISPDLDDFGGLASYALDACTMIENALEYIISENDVYANQAIESLFDTLDMFIQEKESISSEVENFEQVIRNNLFMLREFERQRTLISVIADFSSKKISQAELDKCMGINLSFGKMLDLSLLPY